MKARFIRHHTKAMRLGEAIRKRSMPFLLLSSLVPVCSAAPFTDGFEGAVFNSFWTKSVQSGEIAPSSAGQVHSGSQSAEFHSVFGGPDKHLNLSHQFSGPTYGRASVWVYDSAADQSSGNYLNLLVTDDTNGDPLYIQTFDFDSGPGNLGSFYYYYLGSGPNNISTGIDRTKAWHEWVIDSQPDSFNFSVDSTEVYSGPGGHPINSLTLQMYGPSWRPSVTAYFDDFSFTPTHTSVPDMSGYGGLGCAMLSWIGLIGMRRFWPQVGHLQGDNR